MSAERSASTKRRILDAIRELETSDSCLFTIKGNERTMTARLAMYLQKRFPGLNVDVEYNRHGVNKRPKSIPGNPKPRNVFPDIVIHRRGNDVENEAVIEMKCWWNRKAEGKEDKETIHLVMKKYQYTVGCFVRLEKNGVCTTKFL